MKRTRLGKRYKKMCMLHRPLDETDPNKLLDKVFTCFGSKLDAMSPLQKF